MRIEPFLLEREQSIYENRVGVNLSESGIHPLTIRELVGNDDEARAVLDLPLPYIQTNGTPKLRQAVARLHPGTGDDEVEITNGGSEANFIVCLHLLEPGDEVVVTIPNYLQAHGLARSLGARVRPFRLRRDPKTGGYRADMGELATLVTEKTKLLCLCNPNNPTGARLRPEELDEIARIADKAGCWVLSDEVYRGAELDGNETSTLHGRLERVVVTGGLSKAYGLPGLRVGWVVGPRKLVDGLWSVHDYTTIAPGALSDHLARIALRPETRPRLLARTRSLLCENLAVLLEWGRSFREPLDIAPPEAGAIAVVHCAPGASSLEIARRARDEEDVLVVPGEHFDLPGTLRIGIGSEASVLQEGLARLGRVLQGVS